MKSAFAVWIWSLGIVARSYRTVVIVAALIALWALTAYEWLGLPESSTLLLILALFWAIAQLLAAAALLGGTIMSASMTAATERERLYLINMFWKGAGSRRRFLGTLLFWLASCTIVGLFWAGFSWINAHSIKVASFLTFHLQRAVSHVLLENVYSALEGLVWIGLSGFLISFLSVSLIQGWREALARAVGLLARSTFRSFFLTSLLSVVVFDGAAYELVTWHPNVSPGFWDYTQMITRFSLALVLVSAGWSFWSLSLARLTILAKTHYLTVTVRPGSTPGKP
jgi:hypothetical protein